MGQQKINFTTVTSALPMRLRPESKIGSVSYRLTADHVKDGVSAQHSELVPSPGVKSFFVDDRAAQGHQHGERVSAGSLYPPLGSLPCWF